MIAVIWSIATAIDKTVHTTLKPIFVPFRDLLDGFLAEKNPMIPVINIQSPNQIPLPL